MGNLYLRLQAIAMLAQELNISLEEAEKYLDKMDKDKNVSYQMKGEIKLPKLNRAQRRYQNKTLKQELTPEQYQDFKSEAINTIIDLEVEKQVKDIMEILLIAMRKNRISEERIDKILYDFQIEVRKKVQA